MKLTFVAVLLLAASSAASAQSLADCRSVVPDAQRLACYDGLSAPDSAMRPQIAPPASTDPAIQAAEARVKATLNDAASARFLKVERRADAVCGFVNAKNEAGGYTGAKLFVHVVKTGETLVLTKPEDAGGEAAHAVYDQHCK